MVDYREARMEEENDLLDFMNFVFSFSHRPHDFRKLQPKAYARAGFHPGHLIASQEGHIRALVATLPLRLHLGHDSSLSIGYIGNVSVHPYARGEGHMKTLMRMSRERAVAQGMDLLVLGGQRQRYNYFGYEKAGAMLSFTVTATNLRHALPAQSVDGFTFQPLEELSEVDRLRLYALFSSQVMRAERSPEEWPVHLRSWQAGGLAVRQDGELIGYLCARETTISEWAFSDPELLLPTLKAWLKQRSYDEVTLQVPLHRQSELALLSRVAEDYSFFDSCMVDVLDWRSVLEKLLRFKSGFVRLDEGEKVVEVLGRGRWLVSVKDGVPAVSETEAFPDLSLDPLEAVRYFFSFVSPLLPEGPGLGNWLPLWFSVPEADAF